VQVKLATGVQDSYSISFIVVVSVVTDSEFASKSANFSRVRPNPNPRIFGRRTRMTDLKRYRVVVVVVLVVVVQSRYTHITRIIIISVNSIVIALCPSANGIGSEHVKWQLEKIWVVVHPVLEY